MMRTLLFLTVCSLVFLVGCLGQPSEPPRYYVLEEIKDSEVVAEEGRISVRGDYLQVGPVLMPRYLDRPQIVSRAADNQLDLGEFDRWAEPLHESFTRVIAGNLGKLFSTSNILIYPNRGPSDGNFYQLRMEVARFDGSLGGEIFLEARWTIVRKQNRREMSMVKESYVEAVAEPGYRAYVSALNNLLSRMSRNIATRIAEQIEKE